MRIINRKHKYFKDKQIQKIYELLSDEYRPNRLIIVDTWCCMLKYIFPYIFNIHYWEALLCQLEGIYYVDMGTIFIFVYAQNYKEYHKHDKQLYSIHALLHESRHVWQEKINFKGDKEKDANQFSTQFINNNSYKISQIMGFKNNWTVEEED